MMPQSISMMKNFVSFLVIISSVVSVNAQLPEIIFGEQERYDSKINSLNFIGASEGALFLKKEVLNDGSWILESYELDSLKKKLSTTVNAPEFNTGDLEVLQVAQIDEHFLMLHSLRQKANGKRKLYLTPISQKGEFLDIPLEVGEIPELKRREDLFCGLSISPDSTKMLLYYSVNSNASQDAAYSLKVFSNSLVLQSSKVLELPYPNELLNIDRMLLDNNGVSYILSGILPEKRATQTPDLQTQNKRYLLFTYNFEKNKLKEFDVNLKDKWVAGVSFGLSPKGYLAIGGFYSNDMYFSIAGTFYFSIDIEKGLVLTKAMKAFDKDFLKEFGNNRVDAGGRELYNYYFDHFLLLEDGSAKFVAEQFYVEQRITMDPGTGRQTVSYAYNYNDLIVVSVNAEGQINWSSRIPKRQVSLNDGGPYSSYALSYNDKYLDIVFNDNPRNYELAAGEVLTDPASFGSLKKSVVSWMRIDENGQMKRSQLFSAKESETILKPKAAFRPKKSALVVFSQFRKDMSFVQLNFPLN